MPVKGGRVSLPSMELIKKDKREAVSEFGLCHINSLEISVKQN